MGGDIDALDEWTAVTSTAACIDLCREREGCKYWTITKGGADSRCQLKAWRGVLEKREGYISGSLPSACCEYDFYEYTVCLNIILFLWCNILLIYLLLIQSTPLQLRRHEIRQRMKMKAT